MTTISATIAKLNRVVDLLGAMPDDLPEPTVSTHGSPEVRWQTVDETTARRIVTFLGCDDWTVHTYDVQRTIATRYLDKTYDNTDIAVVVVVDGANLPDLAADFQTAVAAREVLSR